ncbi:MAG TPA: hypothetical protein DCW31_03235 [Lactobacillus sp.]|nr:hypothetical protein [Lactobacillus sp.]
MPKLKLTLLNQVFTVTLIDNPVAQAVLAQVPLTLTVDRSGENEYYQSLPTQITANAPKTSLVQSEHLYYFAGSNALSLNFADKVIAPYEVIEIGYFDRGLNTLLVRGVETFTIELTRS